VAAARAAWHADLAGVAPERLVFLDESGLDTRLIRTHARAPRGERATGRVPWKRRRLTLIGALALSGMVAVMTVAAATDAAVFLGFVEGVLAPALRQRRPDAVVVLDNLPAHKTPAVRAAFDQAGISHRHLPAYSPDFNPIEPCWAKLKAHLRTRAARTPEALEADLPSALRTITPRDAQAWFRHCKYLPQ
jgi:transposase